MRPIDMDKDTISPRNSNTQDSSISEANKDATKTTAVSTRRRRLIKASAAAVPAIMTLRSGAALALTSLDCRDRESARAFAADNLTYIPDEWVRVPGIPGDRVCIFNEATATTDCYYHHDQEFYDVEGKKLSSNPTNSAIKEKITELISPPSTTCYFVNTAYKGDDGWECAYAQNGVALLDQNIGHALAEALNNNTVQVVHLLAYIAWCDDQVCDITYYPLQQVAGDLSAEQVTTSCMCSVDPTYTDACGV